MQRIFLIGILCLISDVLSAQFDFNPYRNVYEPYLNISNDDSNFYLIWYYNNEKNSYFSDTTFYIDGFEDMQLSYLIDYTKLDIDDTVFLLFNDSIVATYNKRYKKYIFNDFDVFSGYNLSFQNALNSFKAYYPNDKLNKVDSIKYYSKIDNEIGYYITNLKKYNKISIKFKRSNAQNKTFIKFILYGQIKSHIQEIIYLPNTINQEKPILKLCYSNIEKSKNRVKYKNFRYYVSDLGFPITKKELTFYRKLTKNIK